MSATDPALRFADPELATATAKAHNASGKGPRVVPMMFAGGQYRLVPNATLPVDHWRATRAVMEAMLMGTGKAG
jgi:hypothetical protein